MNFDEVLAQVLDLLQRQGRVAYRALKVRFNLDDEYLEGIKDEIIHARRLAVDEAGKVLVWTGASATAPMQEQRADRTTPSARSSATNDPFQAEHRQLTVLFCDLVDSTPLAQQLGPEDYRAVILAYQEAAIAAMQPWGGYVAQYLGDGLMLYFGWPQAHEDAARWAVHASLAIVEAMAPLNRRMEPQYGVRVAVRLGLHTGLTVIGAIGSGERQEALALGDTPNISARLQGLATPNTAVCSAATARLVRRAFALEALGLHQLKGVAEPVPVFRIRGPNATPYSDEDAGPAGVPLLVGRDEELGLLRRCWAQSKAGQGQVVLLSGEAGMGKTALVEVLRAYVRQDGGTRLAFHCSPYHTYSALYPVLAHVQRVLDWQRDDPPEAKLGKLERALQKSRLPLTEGVPLFAAMLSLPLPEEP
jgi:class 3 adenylate cyclase